MGRAEGVTERMDRGLPAQQLPVPDWDEMRSRAAAEAKQEVRFCPAKGMTLQNS